MFSYMKKNGTTAQKSLWIKEGIRLLEYQITCQNLGRHWIKQVHQQMLSTNVWQYSKNNSEAQKWRFVDAGNGYYYIISNLGTALDVNAAGIGRMERMYKPIHGINRVLRNGNW